MKEITSVDVMLDNATEFIKAIIMSLKRKEYECF